MAAGKKVVADASVIVKWFVGEDYTRQALDLRQRYLDGVVDIACPALMPYEVLNALRYNPGLGREQIGTAIEALAKYQILLYPLLGDLSHLCIKNAFEYGISLYDSSYLSLAEYLDAAPFYTADEKLLAKVGKSAKLAHISDLAV